MPGVFVLLAFVLLVFIVGTILMIVCYIRSKRQMRKEESEFAAATAADYNGYASSQVPNFLIFINRKILDWRPYCLW